jgi:sugar phosphate isomerase/epimerase
MLLTLAARSVRPMLGARGSLTLDDLPAFARQTLGLHGLAFSTDLLAGAARSRLRELRDRADKEACAILVLDEPEAQPLGDRDDSVAEAAQERIRRVLLAASELGCNSAAVPISAASDEATEDRVVERLKRLMQLAEQRDLNLLIAPRRGLTSDPERVTALIKKIGGFRVGTMPDFETAAATEDPAAYLRRITPYAHAVAAATMNFVPIDPEADPQRPDTPCTHDPYDLNIMVDAIASVGYDSSVAIDYRGKGDLTLGLLRSRVALEVAISGEAPPSEVPLDDEEDAQP